MGIEENRTRTETETNHTAGIRQGCQAGIIKMIGLKMAMMAQQIVMLINL
jgi:hypothetical protein